METKSMCAAVAAAMALAGCAMATTGGGGASPAPAAMAGSIAYCQRDQLVADGGKLTCNWAATTREACEVRASTTIAAADVASGPDRSTICADGTPLVRVSRK